jgi:hypothetical protein
MADFRIAVEIGELLPEGSPLSGGTFPALSHAVAHIADVAHQQ